MNDMRFSRILITGGCGFIGSYLTERLLENEDASIIIVDNNFSPNVLPKEIEEKVHLKNIDVRNLKELEKIFTEFNPQICFHLAAVHFIPYCIQHPHEVIDVNIRGTSNIQHLCFKHGCNLIQASTADVYKQDNGQHKETSIIKATNIYGYTKRITEEILDYFSVNFESNIFGVSVRIFNVFGSRDTQPHVITEIITQLKNQKYENDINLELGNLEPKRDFIHAGDVADGLISISNKVTSGIHIFNLGSGESWSIKEVIGKIEQILQKKINVEISEKRFRKSDRMNLQAEISKIKDQIGWQPSISIEKGLKLLLEEELGI